MENEAALSLLKEMVTNARKTTKEHPEGFWGTFVGFGTDLNRTSRHIDNDGLRKAYFHIGTMESPFREALNYNLRNQVQNYIKSREYGDSPGVNEVLLDATTNISIYCLSDADGRSTIDMSRLRDDLSESLDDLGEEMTTIAFFNISEAIRNIYEPFVTHWSRDIIRLYEDIENKCDEDWESVMRVLSKKTTEYDNQAIKWKRTNQ